MFFAAFPVSLPQALERLEGAVCVLEGMCSLESPLGPGTPDQNSSLEVRWIFRWVFGFQFRVNGET